MNNRLKLQERLTELLGSNNVYFDPPETIKLKYPCIIYQSDIPLNIQADNKSYILRNRYSATYIDANPDNDITERFLSAFNYCSAGNPYISDNLHHYPFDIYF